MAMPFVGMGLLYKHGYFRQTIDADGHQEHAYPDYDLAKLPILRVLGQDGEPLTVSIELLDRDLYAAVWLVQAAACRSCCWTRTYLRTPSPTGR